MSGRVIVRVSLSRDRRQGAERELAALAGSHPYRQGTAPELLWDFADMESAQFFKIGAEHTPGVQRISDPEMSGC